MYDVGKDFRLKHTTKVKREQHGKCVKEAHTVEKHAKCVVELMDHVDRQRKDRLMRLFGVRSKLFFI